MKPSEYFKVKHSHKFETVEMKVVLTRVNEKSQMYECVCGISVWIVDKNEG